MLAFTNSDRPWAFENKIMPRDAVTNIEAPEPSAGQANLLSDVLCVDLDGTFLRTDSLYEALALALKARPSLIFLLPFWIFKQPYYLKQAITNEVRGNVDPSVWPRNPEVETLIADAKASGKTVELISAADHGLITDTPAFGELFHAIFGSANGVNLKG